MLSQLSVIYLIRMNEMCGDVLKQVDRDYLRISEVFRLSKEGKHFLQKERMSYLNLFVLFQVRYFYVC